MTSTDTFTYVHHCYDDLGDGTRCGTAMKAAVSSKGKGRFLSCPKEGCTYFRWLSSLLTKAPGSLTKIEHDRSYPLGFADGSTATGRQILDRMPTRQSGSTPPSAASLARLTGLASSPNATAFNSEGLCSSGASCKSTTAVKATATKNCSVGAFCKACCLARPATEPSCRYKPHERPASAARASPWSSTAAAMRDAPAVAGFVSSSACANDAAVGGATLASNPTIAQYLGGAAVPAARLASAAAKQASLDADREHAAYAAGLKVLVRIFTKLDPKRQVIMSVSKETKYGHGSVAPVGYVLSAPIRELLVQAQVKLEWYWPDAQFWLQFTRLDHQDHVNYSSSNPFSSTSAAFDGVLLIRECGLDSDDIKLCCSDTKTAAPIPVIPSPAWPATSLLSTLPSSPSPFETAPTIIATPRYPFNKQPATNIIELACFVPGSSTYVCGEYVKESVSTAAARLFPGWTYTSSTTATWRERHDFRMLQRSMAEIRKQGWTWSQLKESDLGKAASLGPRPKKALKRTASYAHLE